MRSGHTMCQSKTAAHSERVPIQNAKLQTYPDFAFRVLAKSSTILRRNAEIAKLAVRFGETIYPLLFLLFKSLKIITTGNFLSGTFVHSHETPYLVQTHF